MARLYEPAPAKINLTLRVLGRRSDGYHALESLVAFADCGDVLTLDPGPRFSLAVTGPHAGAIDGPNLVERAVAVARESCPDLRAGTFTLDKRLPVASGIGGGSADAAATIRLLTRANPERANAVDWPALAARIGSDVPVCLAGRAALMWGRGEHVQPLPVPLPPVPAVLANPGVKLATADVFRALAASPLPPATSDGRMPPLPGPLTGPDDFLDWLAATGNDLELPAMRLAPVIADVLTSLRASAGCRLARMSGTGATCFGVFANGAAASVAAHNLAAARPTWWVRSTGLR